MKEQTYESLLGLRAIRAFRPEPISPADLDMILEAARWTGSAKNRQDWSFIVIDEAEQASALAACGDFTDPLRNAPTAIALVQEPEGYEFDTGRVAQNIMLAADAVGVGSCPVTMHRADDAAIVLRLPAGRRCRYVITLGYPSDVAAPARFGGRKEPDLLIHRNTYEG